MKKITKLTALAFALATCCISNVATMSTYDTTVEATVILDEPVTTEPTDPTEKIVCAEPLGVIDVNQNPTKMEYAVGEELDLTGLKVTLRFFRGGEMYESELDDYEVIYDNVNPLDYPDIFVIDTSEFDSNTPGTYEITIKGTDEAMGRYWMFGEGSFEVTVTEDAVSNWVPTNFEEAVEFANTYGRTLVKDGYICMVNETSKAASVCDCIKMYYEGSCEVIDNSVYGDLESDYVFEVSVFKPTDSGEIIIYYAPSLEFTFDVDENGKITQTDIYGWMPDCITEYESFVEKNGNVLVKDGYIGFVSEICTDAGYDLFFEQSGTGAVELVEEYDFYLTQAPIEAPGSANYMVEIYKPTTAGDITLDWTAAQEWDYDDTVMPICKKKYTIGSDLSVNPTTIKGDVDSDGEVSLTDCVSLKKYLTNKGTLTSLKNADLNGDNKINVFDWCIFKRMIIEEMSISTREGMPTIIDETLTITEEQKEQLWSETARLYPDADLSDFKYVYNQNHMLNSYLDYCFDVYYKDIQLHGYGDINTDGNAYAAIDDRIIIQFLCEPSELENINLTPNEDVMAQLKEEYTNSDYETELIIYFDHRSESEIPIRLAYVVYGDYWEDIYDAVTGEKIETIFYLVP